MILFQLSSSLSSQSNSLSLFSISLSLKSSLSFSFGLGQSEISCSFFGSLLSSSSSCFLLLCFLSETSLLGSSYLFIFNELSMSSKFSSLSLSFFLFSQSLGFLSSFLSSQFGSKFSCFLFLFQFLNSSSLSSFSSHFFFVGFLLILKSLCKFFLRSSLGTFSLSSQLIGMSLFHGSKHFLLFSFLNGNSSSLLSFLKSPHFLHSSLLSSLVCFMLGLLLSNLNSSSLLLCSNGSSNLFFDSLFLCLLSFCK